MKIIKAWSRYNKIYIQVGTGMKKESINYILEGERLIKPWMNSENPNRFVDMEMLGIPISELKRASQEVTACK
ncbi:MAG: hypothetical protein RR795_01325 [Cetobacterium sp.]|uniref:hypothetical protein n=1 Tax=Cetobacterium sp. TaxID=2071632 RepID=UPI002FC8C295